MKKVIFTLFISGFVVALNAQQPSLTHGDLETWTQFTGTDSTYYEPGTDTTRENNFLRTLNALADEAFPLTGPVTVFRENSAHSGNYAARMVSNVLGIFFIPGFLGTGDVDILNQTIHLGRQFNGRPERFQGWYKYQPVSGDSAEFRVWFTRFDALNQQSVLVGSASQKINSAVTSYTQFDLAINYVDAGNPDTLIIFSTPSAGYSLTSLLSSSGQVGSTLWADDLAFVYPAGINENDLMNDKVKVYPTLTESFITINTTDLPASLKVYVYDMNGKIVMNSRTNGENTSLDVSALNSGNYIILVQDQFNLIARQRFIKK
jgi:hypothetical protein